MNLQKYFSSGPNAQSTRSSSELFVTKALDPTRRSHPVLITIFVLVFVLVITFARISTGAAQGEARYIEFVRALTFHENAQSHPAGLAFSPKTNGFYVFESQVQGKPLPPFNGLVKLDPLTGERGLALIAIQVEDPVNLTFDGKAQRLLILQPAANSLVEVFETSRGELDPESMVHYDTSRFGLQNPQGLSVDPASGRLFILDAAGPRLVRVDPAASGALDKGTISSVRLSAPGLDTARGLAFDPSSGHLHVLADKRLYEFSQDGALIASRDLAEFALVQPQGMVFAPSGDLTDDPLEMSLFLVDSGALTSGQILEFTFFEPVAVAADFTSTLIRTTDMGAFSPPSPDPSGLTYLPKSNRLVMVDSEVEEIVNDPITGQPVTHFQDVNVWKINLDGTVFQTANISKVGVTVVPMTNEPKGVTWNPSNGHYYIADDGNKEIYDLNPGADGLIGTSDDSWTHFDTLIHGNSDPVGIAFDTVNNRLFVVDDTNNEVYQYSPEGVLVAQFDVQVYGLRHPESVEFNPDDGTLFILDGDYRNPVVIETTTNGALLRTIDISAAKSKSGAGMAFAPASNGSANKRFYIVDRGVDNNKDPYAVDGKLYEMTAPPANSPPKAKDDNAVTAEDTPVTINVAANDSDPESLLDKSSANTACPSCANPAHGSLVNNLDGTFKYTPDKDFNGSDSFVYQICDILGLCDIATVSIKVTAVKDYFFSFMPVASNGTAHSTWRRD